MRYTIIFFAALLCACGGTTTDQSADSVKSTNPFAADSIARANLIAEQNRKSALDTAFHTALPPVFEGDIIMQNVDAPQANLLHQLMGGKYNHVGIIYQRPKDGMLMVVDLQDSVRVITLTEYVDRSVNGEVCLLRLKNANVTLTEDKTRSLFTAAKEYKGRPFDPVLNWDDAGMYSSELVWKIYNNAMRLTLCPTRKVGDFDISEQKKAELKKEYGKNVSDLDEAVSPDDIYNSKKLEVIYEKSN